MRKIISIVVCLIAVFQLDAQVLLRESFDATTFVPAGWTALTGGTGGTRAAWSRVGNGANPSNTPHSGVGQAKLNGFDAQNGTAYMITPVLDFSASGGSVFISIWVYRDNSYPEPKYAGEGVSILVNTTASATGAVSLGFVARNRSQAPAVSANGWYQYTYMVPAIFNGAANYILIGGTSAYGSNVHVDDVEVAMLNPCGGTPSGGVAYASQDSICTSMPFVLNDTTIGLYGVTYQWQSAPAGTAVWSDIAGATTTPYTVSGGITAATDFRLRVTCTASSLSGYSAPVRVGTKVFWNCYCSSGPNYGESNIGQVTFASGFAYPATAPTVLTSNPAATAQYSDHTGVGLINVVPGGTMPFTATQFNKYGYWASGLAVFGDFNHNSSFSDAGETLFGPSAGPTAPAAPTFTGGLVIPANALPGITRMRFVLRDGSLNIQPCNGYAYGETEDYLVNVISAMPPAPTLSSNSPVCEGAQLRITASIPSYYPNPQYTLSGPGITPTTNGTGVFDVPAACANTGTFSVTVSSQNFTSAATTIPVQVNCVPYIAVSNVTAPSNCVLSDGSFRITGLSPTTAYTLSFVRNGATPAVTQAVVSDAGGAVTVASLVSGNYDQIFVTTAAGCPSNTVSGPIVIPVRIPPATPMLMVNPYPICAGATVTITIANPEAAGAYRWTGPNGFADTGLSVQIPNFNPLNSGTYTAIVTVDRCESGPSNATLAMLAPTPPPVRNNVTYCQFETPLPMTAQTLGGYFVEWFDTCSGGPGCSNGIRSRGSTMSSPNPPTPNTSVPGNVMWLVRQTGANGCPSGFDSVYVRVLPKPGAPLASRAVDSLCQYQVVGPLTVNGTNVKWFTTPTGGVGALSAPTPGTTVAGTYHYYASQTSADGCESDRLQLTIIVKPKPQPPTVTSPVNLCQGDAVYPLTAVGRDLLWYTMPNGGAGVPVSPVINTAYPDSFAYYVTQTENGCESDRTLIGAYVHYKPNGVITASSQSICEDGVDTFSYYGNAGPDAEYVWFAPLSARFITAAGVPGPVVIHFDTAGTSTVQLIINNKGCISKLLAAPITVRPLPAFSFVNRQDVCADELLTVALRDVEPGISSYQWEFGQAATLVYGEVRTGGPFGIRYPRAGHYAVSATATRDGCTSKPLVQDVFVHARPDASITYLYGNGKPLDQFCASDTLQLRVPAMRDGGSYVWTPGAYFQGREDSLNSEVSAVVSRSSYVQVRVRDAFGCESTDSLYVPARPCCGVYFPNAFSPSSQVEQNRIFRPITTGVHRVNNFRVMNRWGQVMWESTQERAGWDGTFRGVPQDMGTYFFYINYRCDDKNIEDKGEVLLIR